MMGKRFWSLPFFIYFANDNYTLSLKVQKHFYKVNDPRYASYIKYTSDVMRYVITEKYSLKFKAGLKCRKFMSC